YHSEIAVYHNNSAPGDFIAGGASVADGGLFASAVRRSLLASVAIFVHNLIKWHRSCLLSTFPNRSIRRPISIKRTGKWRK
ncbi:hypothetical protein V7P28_39665, partial [Klebsiella michiganensis]